MSVRLVLFGPPGAGKGTQAARLSEHFGVPAISTGDIFRANIAGDTELGRKVVAYTSRGALVPDELTDDLVRDRLSKPDAAGGFLLDGYPRNVAQVEALDETLADAGTPLDVVVEITADAEVVRHRLDVYAEQTAPISKVYADRGLLVQVDGIGELDEVTDRLVRAIAPAVAR